MRCAAHPAMRLPADVIEEELAMHVPDEPTEDALRDHRRAGAATASCSATIPTRDEVYLDVESTARGRRPAADGAITVADAPRSPHRPGASPAAPPPARADASGGSTRDPRRRSARSSPASSRLARRWDGAAAADGRHRPLAVGAAEVHAALARARRRRLRPVARRSRSSTARSPRTTAAPSG